MECLKFISQVRKARKDNLIQHLALVPTMGALHAGHRALIQEARKKVGNEGVVIVSIFVNPTQFDKKGDLENYPRDLEVDLGVCEEEGVDYVFCPTVSEVYQEGASVTLSEKILSNTLCGASRTGHFDGVCTVVMKLYNIVQPNLMVFGEKDFQQLAIIRRMVRDLNMAVEIVGVPTVREASGLALSSRNARLSIDELKEASKINATLIEIKKGLESGVLDVGNCKSYFGDRMKTLNSKIKVDYAEVVNAETLQPIKQNWSENAILAVAVFFGSVRLIDHIAIDLSKM